MFLTDGEKRPFNHVYTRLLIHLVLNVLCSLSHWSDPGVSNWLFPSEVMEFQADWIIVASLWEKVRGPASGKIPTLTSFSYLVLNNHFWLCYVRDSCQKPSLTQHHFLNFFSPPYKPSSSLGMTSLYLSCLHHTGYSQWCTTCQVPPSLSFD